MSATEVALNLLVAMVTINTVASSRFNVDQRRDRVAVYGAQYVAWSAFTALMMLGLWISIAVLTERWQFAAIVVIPSLVLIGASAARKPTGEVEA